MALTSLAVLGALLNYVYLSTTLVQTGLKMHLVMLDVSTG